MGNTYYHLIIAMDQAMILYLLDVSNVLFLDTVAKMYQLQHIFRAVANVLGQFLGCSKL
jgi:hypothetical protein